MDRYDFIGGVVLLASVTTHAATLSPYPDRLTPVTSWQDSTVVGAQYQPSGRIIRPTPRTKIEHTVVLTTLKPGAKSGWWNDLDYACTDNQQTGEIHCNGIYLGMKGKIPETYDALKVLENYWLSHKVQWKEWRGTGMTGFDLCKISTSILVKGYGAVSYEDTSCNGGPVTPVQCVVTGPSELVHPSQDSNLTGSTIRDTWYLACSRPTTVTVSTTDDLKLRSGLSHIDSGLYVGTEGVNSMVITVDAPRTVAILSKLKPSTTQPGSYEGSGIITVSWP